MAQRFQQAAHRAQVGAQAELEVSLALARHRRGEVEDAVELLRDQGLALVEQRAGAHLHARVGGQVGGGRELVGQHHRLDLAAVERAAREQGARQARADEAGAAGDEQVHGRWDQQGGRISGPA